MAELKVKIENAEVRGVAEKEGRADADGKKGAPFLVVKIDDEAGDRHELIDRDPENIKLYERGKFYDIVALVKYGYSQKGGGWCKFEVKSIQPVER